jgi:hypothetical protein
MNTSLRRVHRRASACLACFPLLAGCGSSLPAPSEPVQARQIVTSSLDAWKRGEKPEALASATPPVRVNDREWGDGYKLENYEIQGEAQPLGLNVQQAVALQLKDLKGKTIKKTINYVVTTGSQPLVARQDIDE